jgi:trimeric autotransporter adhesin
VGIALAAGAQVSGGGPAGTLAVVAGHVRTVVPGSATATPLGVGGVAVTSSGTVYIADPTNSVVEEVTPSGQLSVIAGRPGVRAAPTAGPATGSDLDQPEGVAADDSGDLYIADTGNDVIEKVTPSGTLSIIAGVAGQAGTPTAGAATSSKLDEPQGIAIDSSGDVFIADTENDLVEKVTSGGTLSILAGKVGQFGAPTPGPASSSKLNLPGGVAVDGSGNLYIADTDNGLVEEVTSGTLSILAGKVGQFGAPTPGPASSSDLWGPSGVAIDGSGDLYIADYQNSVVEKVAGGTLSILAGESSHAGLPTPGPASSSDLGNPMALALDGSGALYIADATNNLVEKVSSGGTLSVIAGDGPLGGAPTPGPAASSALGSPVDVATDAGGDLYIADTGNNVIEKITPSGTLSIVAGDGQAGPPTPGPATSSGLSDPSAIAVDNQGNLYIADPLDYVVEKVTPGGTLSIIAGQVGQIAPPMPGPATSSDLAPFGLAVDGSGDVYIADDIATSTTTAAYVLEVTPSGTLSIVAGTGLIGSPTAGPATSSEFDFPAGLAVDGAGNLYISDVYANVVAKVTPAGTLSIVAGSGQLGAPVPGPATSSPLNNPGGIAVDGSGDLFIANTGSNDVLAVSPSETLSILAGSGNIGPPTPGPASASALNGPLGVAADANGNVYIADATNDDVEEVFSGITTPTPTTGTTTETTTGTTTGPTTGATTPETQIPSPTVPRTTPKAILPSAAFSLPSAKQCVSKRKFTIHVRNLPGITWVSAVIKINHKRIKSLGRSHITALVNLGGLPKGTFVLSITAKATNGRTVTGTRTYHTCVAKRKTPTHTRRAA